jgi:flagellar basal-body rod modification protein FlgD
MTTPSYNVAPVSQSVATMTQGTTPAASSGSGSTLGTDAFLKLLVAQLKYQNPMNPTDPNQFMAQTAQFTMVEKLTAMSKTADSSAANQGLALATSLIGKKVTYAVQGVATTGVVSSATVDTSGTSVHVGSDDVTLDQITSVTSGA